MQLLTVIVFRTLIDLLQIAEHLSNQYLRPIYFELAELLVIPDCSICLPLEHDIPQCEQKLEVLLDLLEEFEVDWQKCEMDLFVPDILDFCFDFQVLFIEVLQFVVVLHVDLPSWAFLDVVKSDLEQS